MNNMDFIQISFNHDNICKIEKLLKRSSYHSDKKEKKKQRQAMRREFEPIGPTMLKNPLGERWGLLAVDGALVCNIYKYINIYMKYNEVIIHQGANKVKRATKDVISALKIGCG